MTVISQLETLNKEEMGSLIVLSGEDIGQYQIARDKLLNLLGFDVTDLSYAYFDLSAVDYTQMELDLVSLPFFSDTKTVILDYFSDITTDKKRYLSDEEIKRFEGYLENPVETTRLVILAPGKLDNKRRLVKILKRDGLVLDAAPLKESELRSYFQQQAVKLGLTFDTGGFELLLSKSNFDFSELTKNLYFLKTFKKSGAVSVADVELAIPKKLQDNIFDLTRLILQSEIDEARNLVRDLRLQGEDEIKLIAIMLTQFRTYLQVQILQEQGKSEQQMVAELSEIMGRKVNPFQIKFALRDSRYLSIGFLKKVVRLLIETDYHIKSGQFDKDYLFDLALLKIAIS